MRKGYEMIEALLKRLHDAREVVHDARAASVSLHAALREGLGVLRDGLAAKVAQDVDGELRELLEEREQQLGAIQAIMHDNNRPVQPLHSRKVAE